MRSIVLVLQLFLMNQVFASDEIDCKSPITTIEINTCIGREMESAEATLNKYFLASIHQNTNDQEITKLVRKSQETWKQYREEHCSAIYQLWIKGTIRGVMHGQCKLQLTKDRTYELWRSYLTFMDSKPPLLPEPK